MTVFVNNWAAILIAGDLVAPGAADWIGTVLWTLLTLTPVAGMPLACVAAVLRYRLYEIDRLSSGTVAYAIVTGLLIGVYAGLALFSPLRQRVQKAVDRRFSRSRYDAEQMVIAFAARLQRGQTK